MPDDLFPDLSEDDLSGCWHALSDALWRVKKEGQWEHDHDDFYAYTKARWSLSKQRTKLLLNFGHFAQMCRQERAPLPESPDNCAPVLQLSKKRWLDCWRLCVDTSDGPITAKHCAAVIERFALSRRKKIPHEVLAQMRVKKAVDVLAEANIELVKPPVRTKEATDNLITLDQRRMNDA